eukprot:9659132-Alexandrium_andersonii.AAC.1
MHFGRSRRLLSLKSASLGRRQTTNNRPPTTAFIGFRQPGGALQAVSSAVRQRENAGKHRNGAGMCRKAPEPAPRGHFRRCSALSSAFRRFPACLCCQEMPETAWSAFLAGESRFKPFGWSVVDGGAA